ncbi:MAG: hypothetical protein ABR549_19370 [Mycobacteriales bacterium]
MTTTAPAGTGAPGRARIEAKTLRTDRWWLQPLITFTVLVLFIIYSTIRAFMGSHYFRDPYISPFYSPCLADGCAKEGAPYLGIFPSNAFFTPAIYILIFPLGFRLTCYYYRKAYYRSFWMSPPACAVAEPHDKYTGETRVPLIGNNVHRYFFYAGVVFNVILSYDAIVAFIFEEDGSKHFGIGLGSLVLVTNAVLLWLYSLSCHSCRHIMGGRLNHFSKHPVRYKFWTFVSKLNHHHMKFAWISLVGVALTDAYVWAVTSGGLFSDPRWIS